MGQAQFTSKGIAGTSALESMTLDFVLAGYMTPTARPGVVATPEERRLGWEGMERRAYFVLTLNGSRDFGMAQDVVQNLLAQLSRSDLLERFDVARAAIRTYLNRAIYRHALRLLEQRRRRDGDGGADVAGVLDRSPSPGQGPAEAAASAELEEMVEQRLTMLRPSRVLLGEGDVSANARAARRHRRKVAMWNAVADLFPGQTLQPPQRARAC